METLVIVNSVLAGITLYFIKDVHADFKDLVKRVYRLEQYKPEHDKKTKDEPEK
jgi:hypothetical protein